MANKRRQFSVAEKVVILRRHLLDQVPVSDLCDELGLNPNVFYRWEKEFFEHDTATFERRPDGSGSSPPPAKSARIGETNSGSERLTSRKKMSTMHSAGETDASSAGAQLARDSRSGCRQDAEV
jgi:transposase